MPLPAAARIAAACSAWSRSGWSGSPSGSGPLWPRTGSERRRPRASVQRLDLPAGGVAPAAPTPGEAGVALVRAGSARAAVQRFLEARAAGDAATAYGLLDRAGRKRYPSPARFERAQADQAVVTAVRVGRERATGAAGADVVTLSTPAAIGPFAGLVPARTVEVWRASRQDGRWRVAADPVSVVPTCPATTAPPRR